MNLKELTEDEHNVLPQAKVSISQQMGASTMDSAIASSMVESVTMQMTDGSNPSDMQHIDLGNLAPTFEPLKVCLDDDTSIEDGDEDMFDDEDFYFGDEDFQALLSRESLKRVVVPVKSSSAVVGLQSTSSQPSSAAIANHSTQQPLNHNTLLFSDTNNSNNPLRCMDSGPSSAASSSGEVD